MDQKRLARIAEILPDWYEKNARDLPWRRDREPYHVWLSEIMLQQTRVEAVKGYYARFLAAVPDVPALAAADPELLHKLWEGLGYYSRVRNLQAAARRIMEAHGGLFPTRYEEIRALPGVGDYTAGAICSICFDLPTPAVDGNVLRLISRLTGDDRCVDEPRVRQDYRTALTSAYPAHGAGILTQALMELGATVCVPNGPPRCGDCPLASLCAARLEDRQAALPVRAKKRPRRQERRTVFVLRCGGRLALRRRPDHGLLAGLWEFPNVAGHLTIQEALDQAEAWGVGPLGPDRQVERTHVFTHVEWEMRCFYLPCAREAPGFVWADKTALDTEYALPTAFRMFRDGTDI